jgi:NAD(P)-dependent dehydrogenase (short-subunit alcohol dehydrogenase family)
MGQLDGQHVVVVGGTAGIGLSTARLAAEQGATVSIAARGKEALENTATDLRLRSGREVAWAQLSIENRDEVRDFLQRRAPFDHLVLPGSTVIPVPYDELTDENARAAFQSKFWGPFWAVFDARAHMRAPGSIVLFSGVAAERPVRGYLVGAAINGALNALTRSLALELGPIGVRVNTIAPGAVATPLWSRLHSPEEVEAMTARASRRLPVGRVGTADEGGHLALCLMTNGFVNGQVVGLDGGALAVE